MKVALVQMDVVLGRPAENRKRATEFVREAAVQSDLVVLPEMWSTGYVLDELSGNLADREGEPLGAFLSDLARQAGVYLAGSRAVERGGKVYNLATVHGPDGRLVAEYAKIHLVPMMEEPLFLTPGDRLVMADLDGLRSGLGICYDLRFCEMFRALALKGAETMILPAEWPAARLPHWRTLLVARAIENQCYMIGCNRVGSDGKNDFAGHSMVVDPWGNILVEGDEEESILYAAIDPAQVAEARTRIPVFRDRRPDVYGL